MQIECSNKKSFCFGFEMCRVWLTETKKNIVLVLRLIFYNKQAWFSAAEMINSMLSCFMSFSLMNSAMIYVFLYLFIY